MTLNSKSHKKTDHHSSVGFIPGSNLMMKAQPHQNVWFVIQEVLIPSTTDSDFKPGSSQILSELDFPIDIEICH